MRRTADWMLRFCACLLFGGALAACDEDAATGDETDAGADAAPDGEGGADGEEDAGLDAEADALGPIPDDPRVYEVALGCYAIEALDAAGAALRLEASGGGFGFAEGEGGRFFFKPSDLATYLLYDAERRYVVAPEGEALEARTTLESDITRIEDGYLPGAQWVLEGSVRRENEGDALFQLRHLASDTYLTREGAGGTLEDALPLILVEAEGCTAHPELSIDAVGDVEPRTWDDGSVFGFAEPHTHLMTNFGFGGGGIFHGSPYHPLGVEHALSDCAPFHGPEGRNDLLQLGSSSRADFDALLNLLLTGTSTEPNHETDGYPTFTSWPNAPNSETHQTQYYRWLERAYLGGLRLLVQHATSYSVLCELIAGAEIQPVRYSCNDMVAIDRSIEETRRLERYIDAHAGGPGEGWFRIVGSPAEARAVINEGKMAVVLGIEVSNLFDCFVTPPDGVARCSEQDVINALDAYYDEGVRVLFPNHKTDNQFTPGDGSKGIMELANLIETGHSSNFGLGCDHIEARPNFDNGDLQFAGINEPREEHLVDEPEFDFSAFFLDPVGTLLDYISIVLPEEGEGDYCQNAGLTDIGEFLITEMMRRGLVIEVDHLPRRSYARAYELLAEYNYPAIGTHGYNYDGRIYDIGGMGVQRFARCSEPDDTRDRRRLRRAELMEDAGMMPVEPFSFDLNGLAPQPDGRFSEDNPCPDPQENPIDYPFTSYAGDITFTEPQVGERTIDYNVEGFVHIGMMPEMIEDLRRDGVPDSSIDALFQSAEAWIRLWERSISASALIP